MSFETSIFFVKDAEGFDNEGDRTDRGGRTKWRISEKYHPRDKYPEFWSSPTWEEAKKIYFQEYWGPSKASELPEHYQAVHLDCAIHSGVSQAAFILQRGLGVADDGKIGPKTISRAWDDYGRVEHILAFRNEYLERVIEKYPEQVAYRVGWSRRLLRLRLYAFGVQYAIPVHPNGEIMEYE